MRVLLFLAVILISCKNSTNESYVLNKYAQFQKGKNISKVNDTIIIHDSTLTTRTYFSYNADHSLKSIKNWLQNNHNPYGHYFKFSQTNLTSSFFLSGGDSCYSYA